MLYADHLEEKKLEQLQDIAKSLRILSGREDNKRTINVNQDPINWVQITDDR